MIEIINKPLLLHLVGYLYYWQMGFNSVFKGLTALKPPAVFPVRSFTAKGICVHEPVQGLNFKCR